MGESKGIRLPANVQRAVGDAHRLGVLQDLQTMGTAADADFDRLTGLAAFLMKTPVALVTLLDVERQWFKSCIGLDSTGTDTNISFCAHAIAAGDKPMIVTDATNDPRFAANPLVTGPDHVRFYAGAPMIVAGARIGTLCVLDREPRDSPSDEQLQQLESLAALAASLFTLKDSSRSGVLAKAALRLEEQRRAIALDAAALASWVWDVRTNTVDCDVLLPQMLNLPRATRLTAREVLRAVDRRDVKETQARFFDTLNGEDQYSGELRVKGFDPPRWLATRGRVIERDEDGRPTLIFGVNYDVTERRLSDDRQRLLLRELNHRVKNTLATVQALASQTVRHASDPGEFLAAFSGRLQALGAAHNLLSDREWRGIGIRELVQIETRPFDAKDGRRIQVSGPDIFLTPDQAVGLGLVLHELSNNALQYGALSGTTGIVDLSWRAHGGVKDRKLTLTWNEHGGPAVSPPARHGFGSILIRRSLAKVLSSEVVHEFRPEGVHARISIPLEDGLA